MCAFILSIQEMNKYRLAGTITQTKGNNQVAAIFQREIFSVLTLQEME